ncbi:tellurite resistance TerB family protein [Rhodopseudomonas palustris]|nr:tellurite resistance TerB family protein [Rhodopseudomonas palustris]
MPNRRSPGRPSERLLEDFGDEVQQAQNEHLMEGIVAGCALVAYADGWVTPEEHDRMLSLIRGFEPITAFGLDEVTATFEALTKRFAADQRDGEAAAFAAVARVKGAARYPALLVGVCCAIAAADGGFDAEERKAALRICEVLGLDPTAFDLADAP